MDTLIEAATTATSAWEMALAQLSWYHGVIGLAYLGAAWFCLLNAHMAKEDHKSPAFWAVTAATLCLLGANTVLHADLFATHFLRAIAKLQGWYAQRRSLQYGTVIVLLLLLASITRLYTRITAADAARQRVALGAAALLLLCATRLVSAHGTDQILNWHLAGVSIGRLLELAGIWVVVQGARRGLRQG